MSVSDWTNQTTRARGIVVTVDPSSRRCEVSLKDRGVVQVAIWETGPVFRWPRIHEMWSICRRGGQWQLDSFVDTPNQSNYLYPEQMQIGDMRLISNAGHIYTLDGQRLATTNVPNINTTGLTTAQITAALGWTPSNGTLITDTTNHLLLVFQGSHWYKTSTLTQIA